MDELQTAVANEPSVFEHLKVYCMLKVLTISSLGQRLKCGKIAKNDERP